MPNIRIDNKEYDLDALSDEAKANLNSVRFVDAEIQRLQASISVCQTARVVYVKALQRNLPAMPSDDTIKLG